jgi:TolB-like protein
MKKPFAAYSGSEPYTFVSYAHADAEVVYGELSRLQQNGHRIWYDEGIGAGLSWRDEVALAIAECTVFLVYMSPSSIRSKVCQQEINFALSRDINVLVVYLEDCQLTPGMELSLNDKQAIARQAYLEGPYQAKLEEALSISLAGTAQTMAVDSVFDSQIQGIAILPLTNRSKDADSEYLGDGIAEELILGMANIEGLRVVSGFSFNSANYDARNLGLKFKVDTMLDGSIQKMSNRLRINARLTRTHNGETIWAQKYDRDMADIFEIQDNVAASILQALKIHTNRDDLMKFGTHDALAYENYLLGTYSMRKDSHQGYEEAIKCFGKAIELDRSFGRAHYQLGLCYWELMVFLGRQPQLLAEAKQAFETARKVGCTPEIPWVQVMRKLDPETRPNERCLVEESLDVLKSPGNDWLNYEYVQLGRCLGAAGLYQQSHDFLSHYLQKVPADLNESRKVQSEVQGLLPILGHFHKAVELLDDQLAGVADDISTRVDLCMLLIRTGQYQRADEQLKLLESSNLLNFIRFYLLYWQGRHEEAGAFLKMTLDDESVQLRFKVRGCAMTGDVEQAINYMEESAARGAPLFHIRMLMASAVSAQQVQAVESTSRFQCFLDRHGIETGWPDELATIISNNPGI